MLSSIRLINDNRTSESGGLTRVNVNKFRYTWLIDNFEYWVGDRTLDSCLESPKFSTRHGKVEINWNLKMSIVGDENISICLKPEIPGLSINIPMHIEVFFLNRDGEEVARQRETYFAGTVTDNYWIDNFVNRDFIIDKSNKLLDRGVLTIVCTIYFVGETTHQAGRTTSRTNHTVSFEHRLGQLDEYERLLFSKTFSDFTLVAGGEELPVHKNILAIKSRVFAAMLEHDTTDKREGRVELVDIEPDVLREMLRFVYVGKVNHLEELAPGLLAAAEKYELDALKTLCEEEIIRTMSLDNVDQWLLILKKCDASKLRAAAIKFIEVNTEELDESEKFDRVKKLLSPSLLAEIVSALLTHKAKMYYDSINVL